MKILVTGAGGFAGLHLLRTLNAEGFDDVTATFLGAPPGAEHGMVGANLTTWLEMDVTSESSIFGVIDSVRPDWVFHLAGQSSVGFSFEDPMGTWQVNATGTQLLLEVFRQVEQRRRRFLLVSSAEVYGVLDQDDQPISEDCPLAPVSPYGVSKAAAEVAVLGAGRSSEVEVVIARSFNHIGPGQDERFVLPSVARQLRAIREGGADPVLQLGNLSVIRDFLDVRDVCRAYIQLLRNGQNGAVYNISSGTGYSLRDIVERLIDLSGTGARLEVDVDRLRAVDIPVLIGDSSRLEALGWAQSLPLDATLQDLLSA